MKRDKSVKFPLDARARNNEIVKDKYQLPILEHLVDLVTEQLDNKDQVRALYTSFHMRYAHGQVQLDEETAKHCNFQILGEKSTSTNRFVTGFYGLTKRPTEFQRANTYVLLDDILIVTKGSKEKQHFEVVRQIRKQLDKENIRVKWENANLQQRKRNRWGINYPIQGSNKSFQRCRH